MDIFRDTFQRVWRISLRLVASVVPLAVAIGLILAIQELVALVLPRDSRTYGVVQFVTGASLIGYAILNAVITWLLLAFDSLETLRSLRRESC